MLDCYRDDKDKYYQAESKEAYHIDRQVLEAVEFPGGRSERESFVAKDELDAKEGFGQRSDGLIFEQLGKRLDPVHVSAT